MAAKNRHYYLLKTARLSGWLLAPLVILFILTGFALRRELGVHTWIAANTAVVLHRIFEWPLVVCFLVHTSITSYFALRRWGWIKSRKRNCR